jgi:hypothetical protein
MMRWVVPVVAVALLATGYAVGTAGGAESRQAKTYVLRPGDEIYMPGLDLQCSYRHVVSPWARLDLDCGTKSTEMQGVRILISPKVAELRHWAEGFDPAWKLLARVRR